MLSEFEKAYNSRQTRKNIAYAREYIRHFEDNEPIPGIEFVYEFVQQMLPLISFYLDKEENAKKLKLRQHVDALRNAAIYYMTFAADNPGAQAIAKKYLAEVVEKIPSRAKEISELLPELKMGADGGL